jgi:hypothetical protein
LLQLWVPPVPQLCVLFGAQLPSLVQVPQSLHLPVLPLQVRACVPQLPQPCVAAPEQVWPVHAPHSQLLLQDCLPPAPQVWVAAGVQLP